MIILAVAIILSLSNSGIIGKVNKAKIDSDTANLREYVNTLRAEWELMTADEQTAAGTFVDYANAKLVEKGYKRKLATDGKTIMNEAATAAVDAGIKVGDTVTGYTLLESTYTTDGSENTCDEEIHDETNPQPQTLKTNTAITWKYLGVNANGEIEIMAYLEATEFTSDIAVRLGGKGGYLKGPEMLNTICENLYSVSGVGTARSMNIDDVNNILGYTGEKGAYYNASGSYTPTKEAKTIAALESELGITLSNRTTPDGKDLGTYYSDYYYIGRTSDVKEMENPENADLVYNTKHSYWLASSCAMAEVGNGGDDVCFEVRHVDSIESDSVYALEMFYSLPGRSSYFNDLMVRPVVKLDPSVKLVKDATAANTWNISK